MNARASVNVRSNRDFPGKNKEETKTRNPIFYKRMITRLNWSEKFLSPEKTNTYQGLLLRSGMKRQD